MKLKKVICSLLFLTALFVACYIFQPAKKGQGADTATKYKVVVGWPALTGGIKLGNPTGLGMDTGQHIVVFHRAERTWPLIGPAPGTVIKSNTILILDKASGKLLDSWGDQLFLMPHGLTVDHENNIWVTDVVLHQVFKFNHEGKLLLKLGEARVAGDDATHFNQPTDIAVARDGSFYVSDGYGNSRIIKFSATGKYLFAWGRKGSNPGEFNIPHGIDLDENGNVYVADRENSRIQVFDLRGRFIKQLSAGSFGNFCSVAFNGEKTTLYATDDLTFLKIKHRGSDVFIFDKSGNVQTRFGRSNLLTGGPGWYHDITIDDEENIYVGDILNNTVLKFTKAEN